MVDCVDMIRTHVIANEERAPSPRRHGRGMKLGCANEKSAVRTLCVWVRCAARARGLRMIRRFFNLVFLLLCGAVVMTRQEGGREIDILYTLYGIYFYEHFFDLGDSFCR